MELLCIKDVYSDKPNRELKFKAGNTYQAEFFGKAGLFTKDEQGDPHTLADGDGRRFLDAHFELAEDTPLDAQASAMYGGHYEDV